MRKLLVLLLALAPIQPLHAGLSRGFPEEERRLSTSRPVAVMVPQEKLGISVDIGAILPGSWSGGLFGEPFIASIDRDRRRIMTANASERAEAAIAPLTHVLEGFDVPSLALETTRSAISATDWFNPSAIERVPGGVFATVGELAEAHSSDQIGLITYRYQMSQDFTQIQVIADITLAETEGLKSLFSQRVMSVVRLKKCSYEAGENVARWAMNDGQNAKSALIAAFARIQTVMPAVLALTPAQYTTATDKKKNEVAFAAGFQGPVLMRDALGPVIWSKDKGFIAILPTPD
ncbi:hypothetical protein [Croceicoccus estronivorus]|uniref:hypothetical protein n=1 Tax=Croceicoccus estronivorus TaxID=1172626 RepID=UPI000B15D87F|nr:hypothetical protein [Croceicoccus estronivorus]